MPLPTNLTDREWQVFVETSTGEVAILAVIEE